MTISVLLADDQELIRSAVRSLIALAPDLTVVGEATDGVEAVNLAKQLHPDVVLMDIRMPNKNGIEATQEICADHDLADVRVLILTTFEEDEYVVNALRAGASGFIGKGTNTDDLLGAIHIVRAGESLLSPHATQVLIDRYVRPLPQDPADERPLRGLEELTDREREVLFLVAQGLNNTQIADEFVISPATVKTHVGRIMTKLYAHDRAQLVIAAYETGLRTPGPR
ncbi:response regulator [Leifsonia sp. McL0607]|uniref:response regulator n=1 Tax=Leifsonia sp. McL0607 TaxID=3415672 RepID=UPI003CF24CA2